MEAGRWTPRERHSGDKAPTTTPTPVPTLAEALATYKATVSDRMKGAVRAGVAYGLAVMARASLAAKPIDELTAFDLARWRDGLLATRKPSTVARQMALPSGVPTWATHERGWIASNPMAQVRKPRSGPGRCRTAPAERPCGRAGAGC